MPEQYLLVANHGTFLDPILLYLTFPDHPLYFFMGEQVYRTPILGALTRYLADPIPVMRQVGDARAVRRSLAILKQGGSIGLYPSGECEWDGFTQSIADSTGKFAQKAHVPLVTFRFEGVYFVGPRWRAHMRHLPTHGHVVGIYDAETLAAMTPHAVSDLIERDLAFDADAWRAEIDQPTRGHDLATSLETLLYLCPRCKQLDTLRSRGDRITCTCGFSARYTDHDVFEDNAFFHTVHEWNRWQQEALCELCDRQGDTFSLSVENAKLYAIEPAVGQTLIASGTFILNSHSIACGSWRQPFSTIQGLAPLESDRIIFTVGGLHFEIRHRRPWNPVMFDVLYNHLKQIAK